MPSQISPFFRKNVALGPGQLLFLLKCALLLTPKKVQGISLGQKLPFEFDLSHRTKRNFRFYWCWRLLSMPSGELCQLGNPANARRRFSLCWWLPLHMSMHVTWDQELPQDLMQKQSKSIQLSVWATGFRIRHVSHSCAVPTKKMSHWVPFHVWFPPHFDLKLFQAGRFYLTVTTRTTQQWSAKTNAKPILAPSALSRTTGNQVRFVSVKAERASPSRDHVIPLCDQAGSRPASGQIFAGVHH